ncbi:MAG: YfiR family protein [Pseudomonadales bacterium]|nr:YfiR family protein [Pseudomonadales bacterium]
MLVIKSFMNRKFRLLPIIIAMTLIGAASNASSAAPDHLKAAYLYNFAKLIYWPESVLSDKSKPLVICTSASDGFTQSLIEISDKPVGGRPVQVVALGIKSDASFCHVVFVDKHRSDAWFRQNNGGYEGQLLVGERSGFIAKGGVINFYLEGDKLRFEVSLANAEERGVQISSRLLRLAKIVEDDQ